MQIQRDGQTNVKHTERTLKRVRFALEDEQKEFDKVEEFLTDKERRVWKRMSVSRKHLYLDRAKHLSGNEAYSDMDATTDSEASWTAIQERKRVVALTGLQPQERVEMALKTQNSVNPVKVGASVAKNVSKSLSNVASDPKGQQNTRSMPQASSEVYSFARKAGSVAETAVVIGVTAGTGGAAAPAAVKTYSQKETAKKTFKTSAKVAKKTASAAKKGMSRLGQTNQEETAKTAEALRSVKADKIPMTIIAIAVGVAKQFFSRAMTAMSLLLPGIIIAILPFLCVLGILAAIISTATMWWQSLQDNHDVVVAEYEEYYDGMFNDLGIETADVTGEMIAEFALTFKDRTILYSQEGRGYPVDHSPKFEFDVVSGYYDDGTPIYKYQVGDYYPRSDLNWGADCSGFAAAVYRCFGFSIPGYAPASGAWRTVGREVQLWEIQPGDVICQTGHVTIYVGGGQQVQMSGWGDDRARQNAINPFAIITIRRLVN